MSKFLANIGAALRAPGFGDRLQAALAAAGGDTGAIARLRALQLQRAELQRQNDARDAQVIGAKNLGFSNDEIGAMGAQDLSLAARQRMALGPAQPPVADEEGGAVLDRAAAIQQAATAIRQGADPNAVRARLHEMGHTDLDPSSTFSEPGQISPSRKEPVSTTGVGAKRGLQTAGDGSELGLAIARNVPQPDKTLNRSPDAMERRRLADQELLNDPRVLAFLDTIAFAEGSNYNTMYGQHRTFGDMRKHPGNVGQTRGGVPQSAAGRYQIQLPTYQQTIKNIGPADMSQASQDLMAVDLLRTNHGLDALQANDLASAVSRLAPRWASFPERVNGQWHGSHYRNQPAVSFPELNAVYNRALQYYSAPNDQIPARKRPPLQVRRQAHRR